MAYSKLKLESSSDKFYIFMQNVFCHVEIVYVMSQFRKFHTF
jgi:hypothetical protein